MAFKNLNFFSVDKIIIKPQAHGIWITHHLLFYLKKLDVDIKCSQLKMPYMTLTGIYNFYAGYLI